MPPWKEFDGRTATAAESADTFRTAASNPKFSRPTEKKDEMLRQIRRNASVFRYAFDAQMERRTYASTELTMPKE